jgi:hypothetical protein
MMFLKIRNGGSWAIHSGIDRVTFGNWNEGRVRRLRDHIKTTDESPGRWSIRKRLCVGHGESPDEYTDWEPDVVYLDLNRGVEYTAVPPDAPATVEVGGVAFSAVAGEGGKPVLQASSAGQGPLFHDSSALPAPPPQATGTLTLTSAEVEEAYEYPAWCFAVMSDGSEKTFAFSAAYLLNENGKTIERIA